MVIQNSNFRRAHAEGFERTLLHVAHVHPLDTRPPSKDTMEMPDTTTLAQGQVSQQFIENLGFERASTSVLKLQLDSVLCHGTSQT